MLRLLAILVCFSSLLAYPTAAVGSMCSMLSYLTEEARSKLERTAKERSLEDAKDLARRAKSALDDAALAAMDCQCHLAYSEFDSAASRARRASNADDAEDFVDDLRRAIRSYNSALGILSTCTRTAR